MVILIQKLSCILQLHVDTREESALGNIEGHLSEMFTFPLALWSWQLAWWNTPQSNAQLSVLPRKSRDQEQEGREAASNL